jgi:hypothetical protein
MNNNNAPCSQCHIYERQRYQEAVAHEATKQELEAYRKPAWYPVGGGYVWVFLNVPTPILVQLNMRFGGSDFRIQEDGRVASMNLPRARSGESVTQIEDWLKTHVKVN